MFVATVSTKDRSEGKEPKSETSVRRPGPVRRVKKLHWLSGAEWNSSNRVRPLKGRRAVYLGVAGASLPPPLRLFLPSAVSLAFRAHEFRNITPTPKRGGAGDGAGTRGGQESEGWVGSRAGVGRERPVGRRVTSVVIRYCPFLE